MVGLQHVEFSIVILLPGNQPTFFTGSWWLKVCVHLQPPDGGFRDACWFQWGGGSKTHIYVAISHLLLVIRVCFCQMWGSF